MNNTINQWRLDNYTWPFFYQNRQEKRIHWFLGAEIIAAEREQQKNAVEIKSFTGLSDLDQFEDALGQYNVYDFTLKRKEPDRELWIALPLGFYESFFEDTFFLEIAAHYQMNMIVFD